eukprot:196069-Pelagomonas_calceolata.AAC.3
MAHTDRVAKPVRPCMPGKPRNMPLPPPSSPIATFYELMLLLSSKGRAAGLKEHHKWCRTRRKRLWWVWLGEGSAKVNSKLWMTPSSSQRPSGSFGASR